ncbi:MAG: valine--tRNA ligase, partial [Planctomycetota bacterium]
MDLKPRLPKRYDAKEIEPKWQKFWEEKNLYAFDPQKKGPIYSIDTPPPTVSGNLHIGHVFSYTHTEIMARYFRMKGMNVYYPMGWDDNGLPSERLTEKELGITATDLPREEFIQKCLEVTRKYEKNMENLWKSLGLSIDWSLTYSTISEKTRRISQRSFLDLFQKGKIYRSTEPMIWCPECLTAIAQAEIETKPLESSFNDIRFTLEDGKDLIIATTRPELLPACVAIFVHPDDKRYKSLVGKKARVPLFETEVEIFADDHVDPEKGTGVVMCCTFGDRQDVEWWRSKNLELKLAITEDGRM